MSSHGNLDTTTDAYVPHQNSVSSETPLSGNELVARYVGQILQGCNNSQCTEPTCRTRRHSRSGRKPFRDFTARSARAMAITLCLSSAPLSRLCRHYKPSAFDIVEKSPPDPSSFIQRLCDTPSVRSLGTWPPSRSVAPTSEQLERTIIARHRASLKQSTEHLRVCSSLEDFNPSVDQTLLSSISWLLDRMPSHKAAVEGGLDVPSIYRHALRHGKEFYEILDCLDNEGYLDLLSDIVIAVMERSRLETRVTSLPQPTSERTSSRLWIELFSETIAGLGSQRDGAFVLTLWLERLFARYWNGGIILEQDSMGGFTLFFMLYLSRAWRKGDDHLSCFDLNDVVDINASADFQAADPMRKAGELLNALESGSFGQQKPSRFFSILVAFDFHHPFNRKAMYFRAANLLRMRKAYSIAVVTNKIRRRYPSPIDDHGEPIPPPLHLVKRYLLLSVSRSDVLKDAFDQLWKREDIDLLLPLRVRLGEADTLEVGQDLGGVQIEFFNLVCRELFLVQSQMFLADPETGFSYFQPGSLQPLYMFELCGILFALAVYNGIPLPIDLNPAFYCVMFNRNYSCKAIHDSFFAGWPTLAKSLRAACIDGLDELECSFPLEANGLRMDVLPRRLAQPSERMVLEYLNATPVGQGVKAMPAFDSLTDAWPGWKLVAATQEPEPVTKANRAQYFSGYIEWMMYRRVAPQFDAFLKGFYSHGIVEFELMQACFTPLDLQQYLEGTKDVNIETLKRCAQYDGFDQREADYIAWFWQIVGEWSQEKQRQLLKFVTASERIPLDGPATFIIERWETENLNNLPRSSTCYGRLQLPRYTTREMLAEKLSLAVECGMEGFGVA